MGGEVKDYEAFRNTAQVCAEGARLLDAQGDEGIAEATTVFVARAIYEVGAAICERLERIEDVLGSIDMNTEPPR